MKKSDLISEIASSKNLSIQDAEKIVSIIINDITRTLFLGDRAEFRGFGIFSARIREERRARNPKTGETITIKRKLIPHGVRFTKKVSFKTMETLKGKIKIMLYM